MGLFRHTARALHLFALFLMVFWTIAPGILPSIALAVDDEDESTVTICHQPGTPAEQTLEVDESALSGHLGHGDTEGPCEDGDAGDDEEDEEGEGEGEGEEENEEEVETGSITVCKVLADDSGTVTDGSVVAGAVFTIPGIDAPSGQRAAGTISDTVFSTPLDLNTDLFGDSEYDAECVTYDGLDLGNYFYGEEIQEVEGTKLTTAFGENDPLYHDHNSGSFDAVDAGLLYSGELFDEDVENDDERATNADGHIVLSASRPDRVLVVQNTYNYTAINQCTYDNILLNGSFEAVDSREGFVHENPLNALASASAKWDVYAALPDVTDGDGVSWYRSAGTGIEVMASGVVAASHDGSHHVELDSHTHDENQSGTNTTMSQDVEIYEAGDYTISFWYKARTENAGDNTINVFWDGTVVETVDEVAPQEWTQYTVTLESVTAGEHTISFAAVGDQTSYGAILDSISLTCDLGDDEEGGEEDEEENDDSGDDEGDDEEENTGSITICKVLYNEEGEAVAGDDVLGATFTLPGLSSASGAVAVDGVLPDTVFSTPLDLNTDLFGDSEYDAECVTYSGLAIGGYLYGEEAGTYDNDLTEGSFVENVPEYHDNAVNYNGLGGGDIYSGELFTEDTADDSSRNTIADGHILLTGSTPDRVLVLENKYTDPRIDQCTLDNILLNGTFEARDARIGLANDDLLNGLLSADKGWDVYDALPDDTDGSGTSWYTVDGSGIEVQSSGVAVDAQSGDYYIELDSHANNENGDDTNSEMAQDIELYEDGDYHLTFWYRARTADAGDNTVTVLWDETVIATLDGVAPDEWTEYDIDIPNGTAGWHMVSFVASGDENGLGGFIDTVGLTCGSADSETDDGGDDGDGGDNGGGGDDGETNDASTTSTIQVFVTITNDDLGTAGYDDVLITVSTTPALSALSSASGTIFSVAASSTVTVTATDLDGYTSTQSGQCDGTIGESESWVCTIAYDDDQDGSGGNGGGPTEETPTDEGEDNTGGGGSGGGGGSSDVQSVIITQEAASGVDGASVTITWRTDRPATSRVVYGTQSVSAPGEAPLYGYEFTTEEDSTMVVDHSMTITGLTPGVQYFFRPVSHASPEVYGVELTLTAGGATPVSGVLGTKITDDGDAEPVKAVLGYQTLPVTGGAAPENDFSQLAFAVAVLLLASGLRLVGVQREEV